MWPLCHDDPPAQRYSYSIGSVVSLRSRTAPGVTTRPQAEGHGLLRCLIDVLAAGSLMLRPGHEHALSPGLQPRKELGPGNEPVVVGVGAGDPVFDELREAAGEEPALVVVAERRVA